MIDFPLFDPQMVPAFDRSSLDHATVGNVLLDGAIRWFTRFDGCSKRICQRPGQCIDHFDPEWTINLCFKAPKAIGDASGWVISTLSWEFLFRFSVNSWLSIFLRSWLAR